MSREKKLLFLDFLVAECLEKTAEEMQSEAGTFSVGARKS